MTAEDVWSEIADDPAMPRREVFWNGALGAVAPLLAIVAAVIFLDGVQQTSPPLLFWGAAGLWGAGWIGRDAVRAYRQECRR